MFALTKMRFAKKDYPVDENHNGKLDRWVLEDCGRIIYNDRVTIREIPMAAYEGNEQYETKKPREDFLSRLLAFCAVRVFTGR